MRAVLCTELGPFDGLQLADVESPTTGPGQVKIAVHAASLNFPDLLVVQGLYQMREEPPFVPGAEGAGVVVEVGPGVHTVEVGDRVMAVGVSGAFAEEWVIDADRVAPVPEDMDFVTAASLMLAYGTAYHALTQRGALQRGETLLVLGAAGGVGAAAVEIGAALGAEVIAAASSDDKLEFCTQLGARHTINYADDDLRGRIAEITDSGKVDLVFDPVGGDLSEAAIRSTAPGGRYLIIGFASGDIPSIPLNLPLLKEVSLVGVFWGAFTQRDPEANRANASELFAMIARGDLEPRVTDSFPLDRFDEAFATLAERRAHGKVVISVQA